MTVRSTMNDILLELRGLTDATNGETTVDGVDFWTDEQLQAILDAYRTDALDLALVPAAQKVAGNTAYLRYYFPDNLATTVEPDFTITDSEGNVLSNWTYTKGTRYILFASDQSADSRLITCNAYNLRKSAARVWLTKASQRTALIDWKAGGQTLSEDQEYQHCMEKFAEFAGPGGISELLPGVSNGTGAVRLTKAGSAYKQNQLVNTFPLGNEINLSNGPMAT